MPTGRATPRNIDEYIASFSPDVQAILEKIRFDDQAGCTARAGDNQLQNSGFHARWNFGVLRCVQEAHRILSTGEGRRKAREGDLNLRRREGQFAISAPSADTLRPN
jgi:hypothetical protein